MESYRKTPGNRSSDRQLARSREYNKFKKGHLSYNEFKKIDFIDSEGRQYVFNENKRTAAEPKEYDEPPVFLTDKSTFTQETTTQKINYGTISLSVRIPSRSKTNVSNDFPNENSNLYLFNEETGVVCVGKVREIWTGQIRSKSARIVLRNFQLVTILEDPVQFSSLISKLK